MEEHLNRILLKAKALFNRKLTMAENLNEMFLARCVENNVNGVQSCLYQGAYI